MTMTANYYDLNFGKSSKTAKRYETHEGNENEMLAIDSPGQILHSARKVLKFDSQSPECEKRYTREEQVNSRNQENRIKDINNITASSFSSLPHPKSLRKRLNNKSPKRKISKVNHDQALSVENHIKQMKFYVARISRDDKSQMNNNMEENCNIPVCDFEIPPLPEIGTPVAGFNSYSSSLTTPPQLSSQTVHRDIDDFHTSTDSYDFINDKRSPMVNSNFYFSPNAENHQPSGSISSNDDAWFYPQWKPRYIFPSTEE